LELLTGQIAELRPQEIVRRSSQTPPKLHWAWFSMRRVHQIIRTVQTPMGTIEQNAITWPLKCDRLSV
jgi:hypothetical protein